jgi:cytochrome P450
MEEMMQYSLLGGFFLLLAVTLLQKARKHRMKLPPSPPGRLILGHLPLLKQPKAIHRTLHDISQKYGPIVTLKFGFRTVIIVSSPAAVEECFTKNDITLANRPPFLNGKVLNYNFTTLAAAPYGDHWRNLRRLTAIEVFSASRLNTFASIRREEVKNLLRKIHRLCGDGSAVIELRTMLLDLNFNVMMRMVAGKKYYGEDVDGLEESKRFKDMMHEFSECTRVTNLGDLFPILQCIDYDGFKNRMTQLGKRMDAFWQGLIDEHRVDKTRNTMVSHLLALQESEPEYYTDEIIKGIILVSLKSHSAALNSILFLFYFILFGINT